MSPCETCSRPGECCKNFVLSPNFPEPDWQSASRSLLDRNGLTYFRIEEAVRSELTNRGHVAIRCSCLLLGDDGRCRDYENRPVVCRLYRPLSDNLCAEFIGPPRYREPEHVAFSSESLSHNGGLA